MNAHKFSTLKPRAKEFGLIVPVIYTSILFI